MADATTPSMATKANANVNENTSKRVTPSPSSPYYAMVVDSGPIIKQDVRNLMGKATTYVTTPSVLREIRDSKARQHLEHSVLPLLDLKVREPSDKAIQDVIAFAKQTGDYAGLSTVDLQVLALTLDLEREGNLTNGNTNLDHIRTTPKRKIGLGSILPMNKNAAASAKPSTAVPTVQEEKKGEDDDAAADAQQQQESPTLLGREDYDEVEDSDDDEEGGDDEGDDGEATAVSTPPVKKSWAILVNPTVATAPLVDPVSNLPFASMKLSSQEKKKSNENGGGGGQFDDASDDEDDLEEELESEFPSLLAASAVPYEGEDDEINNNEGSETTAAGNALEGEDKNYNGETGNEEKQQHTKKKVSVFMTDEEKQKNLQPVSKSGRVYNSFRKYKGLMKPKQPVNKKPEQVEEESTAPAAESSSSSANNTATATTQQQTSRVLGGSGGGETMFAEDDDGQGWITSSDDIKFMKNEGGGRLDPGKTGTIGGPNDNNNNGNVGTNKNKNAGPPMSQRTACATTDFAMQNVLLQMNLVLLSTEGMRIRRLKSWVIRCGACFKIHGAEEDFKDETNHHMKRLFCSHCGSGDMMQRISASVDGKTGRLKLHFSKRKQGRHHSIRGTKFSLPKPGSGNRFKGDLLLREDQLLSGAWNQKVKINSGNKYQTSRSQSMFGRDIASSVGCNVKSMSTASFGGKGWSTSANTSANGGFGTNTDDIRVGFGARKNPNAAKGRERRGKKKKSDDRACGMRRY